MKSTYPKDKFGRPRQLLLTRVSSLNLQGTGQKRGILRRREVYTTTLHVDVAMGNYKWRVSRSFEECVKLHSLLYPMKEIEFQNLLPSSGVDIEDDTFILLQRKEALESFLAAITTDFDVFANEYLFRFLECDTGLVKLFRNLVIVQARGRGWLVRRHLLEILASLHAPHVLRLREILVEGVTGLDCFSSTTSQPIRATLKLIPAETQPKHRNRYGMNRFGSGLDRLVVAERPRSNSVAANNPSMSMISFEIRLGLSSHFFWVKSHPGIGSADTSRCLSIIGTERTIDLQLPSSAPYTREWFTTYLHLLASVTNPNLSHYHRLWNNSLVVDVSRPVHPDPTAIPIAEKLHAILMDGIEVHVEWIHSFENESNGTIEEMLLWFNSNLNRLEMCPVSEAPIAKNTKGIYLDDISEVRPGIRGMQLDTQKQQLAMTIVASELCITLPLASRITQVHLISQFRAFVSVYRSVNRNLELATKTIASTHVQAPISQPTTVAPRRRRSLKEEQENERGSISSLDAVSVTSVPATAPATITLSFAQDETKSESSDHTSNTSTTVEMDPDGRTSSEEYFAEEVEQPVLDVPDAQPEVTASPTTAKKKKNIVTRAAHKIRKSIHKQFHI